MKKNPSRKKKRLGSYPFLSVIFSITLALFVMGLFGLLFIHSHKLSEYIKEQMEVQVYLDSQLSESRVIGIQQTLASMEFTLIKDNEPQLLFISKEQALEKFTEQSGENPEDFLGHNPLRDVYLLKLKPEYQDSTQLAMVKEEIEAVNGVFEVSYLDNIIADINRNTTKIGLVLIGFFWITPNNRDHPDNQYYKARFVFSTLSDSKHAVGRSNRCIYPKTIFMAFDCTWLHGRYICFAPITWTVRICKISSA